MYVHTCWKRRDTASDNGVASRQRKSSHEKCTPRRNLPDNKVEREENRTRDHTVPLFRSTPPSLSASFFLLFSFLFSFFFLVFAVYTTARRRGHRCADSRNFLITRSFEAGKPYDSFLELPRFLPKIRIERN